MESGCFEQSYRPHFSRSSAGQHRIRGKINPPPRVGDRFRRTVGRRPASDSKGLLLTCTAYPCCPERVVPNRFFAILPAALLPVIGAGGCAGDASLRTNPVVPGETHTISDDQVAAVMPAALVTAADEPTLDTHPSRLPLADADRPAADFGEAARVEADRSGAEQPVLVEFGEVLAIASGRNPQIRLVNSQIREAFAELAEAEALWLPSIRVGANYHYRDGVIQNAPGMVFDTSRNGMYAGLGSRVVGGGAVGMHGVAAQFHLADAVFRPRISERTYGARRWAAQATQNDTLLAVSLAYLRVLESMQEESIATATYENAERLRQLCRDFGELGMTPEDNIDRAETELALRLNQRLRARENVQVASAELVRLLSGDSSMPLVPSETGVAAIHLIDPDTSARELVIAGLSQRPELQQNRALVGEAVERLNREQYAPLLPSVLLGMSYGGMAAGQGGYTGNAGDRFDFDAVVFWELRQLGLGDRAIREQARQRVEQSRWRQVQLMDLVAQEITAAHAQVQVRRDQIEVARRGVESAVRALRRNLDRIREGEGLPIEVLQAIQALDSARREYLRVLVDYNEAQFRLYRAIGWTIDRSLMDEHELTVPEEHWKPAELLLPPRQRRPDGELLPTPPATALDDNR